MGRTYTADQSAPAREWVAVTPSDSVNLPAGCRGLYSGNGGDITLVGAEDGVETFTAVPAGIFIPCGPKRVNATGTTAANLIALY